MSQKVSRPKVKVPGYVKDMAMLSAQRTGKVDRTFIRLMCSAVDSYEKHRNAALKKVTRDLSDND